MSAPNGLSVEAKLGGTALALELGEVCLSAEASVGGEVEAWLLGTLADPASAALLTFRVPLAWASPRLLPVTADTRWSARLRPPQAKASAVLALDVRRCVVDGRSFSLELGGSAGVAGRFELQLHGVPNVVRAVSHHARPKAEAEAFLTQVLGGLEAEHHGVTSEFLLGTDDDDTRSLTWSRSLPEPQPAAPVTVPSAAAPFAHLEPTANEPLFADGRLHRVRSASLRREARPGWVDLALELDVDETSGEDGALAPRAVFSVPDAAWRWPPPCEWHAVDLTRAAAEGWYGNDAPELFEHRLAIRAVPGDRVEVDWSAVVGADLAQAPPLRFRGTVKVD